MVDHKLEYHSDSLSQDLKGYKRVKPGDLEFEEQIKLMWGWCWRGICVSIITIIIVFPLAFIVGFIGVFILSIFQIDHNSAKPFFQAIGFILGMLCGFISILPLIKWLTKVKFGSLELWIVKVPSEELSITNNNQDSIEYVCSNCKAPAIIGQKYCSNCGELFDET